jgi:hypothetical protein
LLDREPSHVKLLLGTKKPFSKNTHFVEAGATSIGKINAGNYWIKILILKGLAERISLVICKLIINKGFKISPCIQSWTG